MVSESVYQLHIEKHMHNLDIRTGGCWAAVVVFNLLVAADLAHGQAIQTGTIPARLKLVATVTNSTQGAPNFGVNSGDPRFLYVGEQNGRVRTLDFSQPNPLLGSDFLNIDAAIGAGKLLDDTNIGERGLLGAAFHPDFNNAANPNGYRKFYTYTSENFDSETPPPRGAPPNEGLTLATVNFAHQSETPAYNHQSVIREWTAKAPDVSGVTAIDMSVASRVVMRIAEPGQFHNGGGLAFGPDNYLYVSLGDGGAAGNDGGNNSNNNGHTNPNNPDTPGGYTGHGNAQDRRNVFGSILRVKPTVDADADTNPSTNGGGYRVPKSNPFTVETNTATPVPGWQDNWVDEIFAFGFRNPFRISFDSATGKLYAADVGQDRNTSAREEVSVVTSGGNYGWIIKAGTQSTEFGYAAPAGVSLVDPVAQYPTTQLGSGGLAAIGGFVYRGDLLPELSGKYVFADLNRGNGTGGRLLYADVTEPGLNTVFDLSIAGTVQKPTAFVHGVAEDAAGEIYYLFGNGQIMKLVPEPASWAMAALGILAISGLLRRRT